MPMAEHIAHDKLALPQVPLVAKSIPPSLDGFESLPERLERLIDQARYRKITFVNAPEGYGKTAVLSSWFSSLRAEGLPAVWFACDENDSNADYFWMNFSFAVCRAFEGTQVPGYDELAAQPAAQAAYLLANALCLTAVERGGVYLIMERADLLESEESRAILSLLISSLSDDVHLVLSSRRVLSKYDFEGALTAGVPLVISSRDLALTRAELVEALRERVDAPLDEKTTALAYEKTRGWPFAVGVLVDRMNVAADPAGAVEAFSGMDPSLREFFEHEVFALLPQRLRDFLAQTSFLGVLNARLCSYVLDQDDAAHILDELLELNIFLEAIDASGQRFVRHPLFTRWLLEAKGSQLPVVERRHLNGRAAHWALRHGMDVAAAKHQIMASEHEDIFELAACAFPHMQADEIANLTLFPEMPDVETLDPCFMMMAAWAYSYAADVFNMTRWAQRMRARHLDEKSEEVRLSLAVLDVKGLCLQCSFDEGLEKASEVAPLLKGNEHLPLRILLANCRAEAYDHQGQSDLGMKEHEAFAVLAGTGSFAFLNAINQYEMAYSQFEHGHLSAAAQLCKTTAATTVDDHPVRGALIALEVLMGVIGGARDNVDERLGDALSLVSKRRNADMYLDWCVARAWSYAAAGKVDRGDEVISEAMNMVRLSSHAIPRGTSVLPFQSKAMLALLRDDKKTALEAYLEFDRIGVPETAYATLVRRYVELACSEQGDPEQALGELVDEVRAKGYCLLELDLTIDLAMLRYQRGQRTAATRLLHEALEYAVKEEVVSPFLWRANKIRPLLVSYVTSVKANFARRMFVQRLLKRPEFSVMGQGDALELVGLTNREREILGLAMEGLTRQEIAAELCVGDSTVKSHLSHMYAKLGVKRFKDLLSLASDLNL